MEAGEGLAGFGAGYFQARGTGNKLLRMRVEGGGKCAHEPNMAEGGEWDWERGGWRAYCLLSFFL
jgi:hypothetical protein